MASKLGSYADRSIRHLRWSQTADGWGGDEDVAPTVLNDDLSVRFEWIEGVGDRWAFWVFEVDADVQVEDIFLVDDVGLAVMVERVAEFTNLKGRFHHYEVNTVEHELSLGQIEAQIP